MKIGIFDPYLDDLGGGEKYMMKTALCLAEKADVDIFWDSKEDLRELKNRFLLDISKIKLAKNIFSPQTPLFQRLVQSRKYDMIILLSDGSIPLLLSRKIFIHFQQPIPDLNLDFKTKIKKYKINKFFCNSFYTKSYIDKSLKINNLVLYPPVDLKARNIKKENIILHVGRFRVKNVGMADYKKQTVMIKAFKDMIDENLKGWRFIIAVSVKKEEEDQFSSLKNWAKGYPIEFIVNKNNDQLWDTYSRAKIYWHASGYGEDLGKHPEFAEHFGISTVEAMGGGAVPVVFGAGGQKEIVENGKSGFLWDSLRELREKTNLLIFDTKLLNKMSYQAKKRAQAFSGDRFCRELYGMLNL